MKMKKANNTQKRLKNFILRLPRKYKDNILLYINWFKENILYAELTKALGRRANKRINLIDSFMRERIEKILIRLMDNYKKLGLKNTLKNFEYDILEALEVYDYLDEAHLLRVKSKIEKDFPKGEDLLDEYIGYFLKLEGFKDNFRNLSIRGDRLCSLFPEFPQDKIKYWNKKCISMPPIRFSILPSTIPSFITEPSKRDLIHEYQLCLPLNKRAFICCMLAYKYRVSPTTINKELSNAFKLLPPLT